MVKTGQFTTKCKGDRVIALKRKKTILVGLRLERYGRLYQRSHAKNHTCCEFDCSTNKWPF